MNLSILSFAWHNWYWDKHHLKMFWKYLLFEDFMFNIPDIFRIQSNIYDGDFCEKKLITLPLEVETNGQPEALSQYWCHDYFYNLLKFARLIMYTKNSSCRTMLITLIFDVTCHINNSNTSALDLESIVWSRTSLHPIFCFTKSKKTLLAFSWEVTDLRCRCFWNCSKKSSKHIVAVSAAFSVFLTLHWQKQSDIPLQHCKT